MIKFIYFWRVTHEKGIDQVIEVFSQLHQEWITNWFLDIYGDGVLLNQCKNRAKKLPNNIHVHWRANQNTIHTALHTMHYCLMPSRVIESFWMSALESLSYWVPVIGTKTWWLEQFISDEYDCNQHTLYAILKKNISHFSPENRRKEAKVAHEIATQYTREQWIKKVKHMGNTSSVFLISDYIARIWWIESLLFNIKYILEDDWSHIYMYWWKLKKNKRLWLWRKLWLFSTSYNRSNYIKIRLGLAQHKPTLVWLHSVNRYLWWFPISALQRSQDKQIWCSVHDIWMFHPFGADVSLVSDIPEFSLSWFVSVTKNPLKKIIIWLKFMSLLLLKKQLMKKVDMWIVPSRFMVDVLHKKRNIPLIKITTLPHFIS